MRTYVTLKQHSRKGLRLPSDSTETQNAVQRTVAQAVEPASCGARVTDGVLRIAVAETVQDEACIVAAVGKGEAARTSGAAYAD